MKTTDRAIPVDATFLMHKSQKKADKIYRLIYNRLSHKSRPFDLMTFTCLTANMVQQLSKAMPDEDQLVAAMAHLTRVFMALAAAEIIEEDNE